MSEKKGLRFNNGKLPINLIPNSTIEGIAQVLAYGANKYTVTYLRDKKTNEIIRFEKGVVDNPDYICEVVSGADNWRNGMPWTEVLNSLERHLLEIKKGYDYDEESTLLHIDHLLTNAAFIKEYYKIHPNFDNRKKTYLSIPKIGLDIDDCLNNFVSQYCDKFKLPIPSHWYFDRQMYQRLNELPISFWENLTPKFNGNELKFTPTCYITSRSVPVKITEDWLDKHNFPVAPVYSVGLEMSKVDAAKKAGIEYFIDDRYENFIELTNAGITTFLLTAEHNKNFNVGYYRINSVNEILDKIK